MQGLLVVSQMALSLLLLLGAGLLLRSLAKAAAVDPGFNANSAVAVSFDPALLGYSGDRRDSLCRDLLDRVGALPGYEAASLAALLPLSGRMLGLEVAPVPGGPQSAGPLSGGEASAGFTGGQVIAYANAVHPGFFRTLGIPLLRGRDFGPGDRRGAPGVAIVNETLARRFWPGEEPLGRFIDLGEGELVEVIGVARDGKYDELSEDPRSYLYVADPQHPGLVSGLTLVVRAAGDPGRTLAEVRRIVRELIPDLPLSDATTLVGLVHRRSDRQRGLSTTLASFGALALLLAGVGLHGVVGFAVARRRREIGLRMALGAGRGAVVRQFVGQGVRMALAGVAVGIVPAAILTWLLSSFLFGIRLSDLTTFAAVAILLVAVAALAGYLPARRAARVDPMTAIRSE
jgi:putative ABC transport system permease protein